MTGGLWQKHLLACFITLLAQCHGNMLALLILSSSLHTKGALFNLATVEVLNIPVAGLLPGTYTFYLAVDMNMNGSLDLDQLFFDSVVVNVIP